MRIICVFACLSIFSSGRHFRPGCVPVNTCTDSFCPPVPPDPVCWTVPSPSSPSPFSTDHGSARERTTRTNCSGPESGAPGVLPTDRRDGGGRMRWARWQPARIRSNERAPGVGGDEGRGSAHAEIETSALARTHTWRRHRLTDTNPKIFSETSTGSRTRLLTFAHT